MYAMGHSWFNIIGEAKVFILMITRLRYNHQYMATQTSCTTHLQPGQDFTKSLGHLQIFTDNCNIQTTLN